MAQQGDVLLRLKAMEKSFTFLLMEAATRLSELTESQMFIMIESPEGRTFTGSPSLCDKYATQGLIGQLDDVLLRMDEPQPQSEPTPGGKGGVGLWNLSVPYRNYCAYN